MRKNPKPFRHSLPTPYWEKPTGKTYWEKILFEVSEKKIIRFYSYCLKSIFVDCCLLVFKMFPYTPFLRPFS